LLKKLVGVAASSAETNIGGLLRHGHQLKNVAIEILEVETPAAVPIVKLPVIDRPGGTAEGKPSSPYPLQDRVELSVVDVES
jgi:hypothetical protein